MITFGDFHGGPRCTPTQNTRFSISYLDVAELIANHKNVWEDFHLNGMVTNCFFLQNAFVDLWLFSSYIKLVFNMSTLSNSIIYIEPAMSVDCWTCSPIHVPCYQSS